MFLSVRAGRACEGILPVFGYLENGAVRECFVREPVRNPGCRANSPGKKNARKNHDTLQQRERKIKRKVTSIIPEHKTMPARTSTHPLERELQKAVDAALGQMRQAAGFNRVRFVLLYGSAAEGRMTPDSDIDLCVYYDGSREEAAQFRHAVLARLPDLCYDVQIFQLLPLYVRVEVLRGIPVYVHDMRFLYETATRTLREFGDFKHRLYDYTGQAAIQ
jgi:predicted nucleotidyltransferase